MLTRFIPRLLVVTLLLAFVVTGLNRYSADAKTARLDHMAKSGQTDLWGEGLLHLVDWTETQSQEAEPVQKCDGFDITNSYTANIAHHLTIDNSGDEVIERMTVDFAGAIGNSQTGKSYAYAGTFTRWSDYVWNKVTINDLELRFEVGTPGQFTIGIDRIEMDLVADPAEVIKTFVPNALQTELCYLLADAAAPSAPQSISATVHTENSVLEQSVAPYDERSVSNPSANVPSGENALPCEPRKGYPQDCAID
jgi:hypothetical protein